MVYVVVSAIAKVGVPEIDKTLNKMMKKRCSRVLLVPLYPQYAASTTSVIPVTLIFDSS